ncbi:DMT family transporter [Pontibacillus halophilus]|nr:multidrug efflux SMR transporter [Pontibacillus halophilus]
MGYLYLSLAIISEVFGSTMLKLSSMPNVSKFLSVGGVGVGYLLAFFFLQRTLIYLPLGLSYAMWAGVGTALTVLVGILLFKEPLNLYVILGVIMIIGGTVVLNVGGGAHE